MCMNTWNSIFKAGIVSTVKLDPETYVVEPEDSGPDPLEEPKCLRGIEILLQDGTCSKCEDYTYADGFQTSCVSDECETLT